MRALGRPIDAPAAGEPARRALHRRRQHCRAAAAVIWAEAEGLPRRPRRRAGQLIDLTAGFGVAALGTATRGSRPRGLQQKVVHALGDLAEAAVTAQLRRAGRRIPRSLADRPDAVEIALRTALAHSGRPGIVAFENAYHGTGLAALAPRPSRRSREPFAKWLPGPVYRHPYGFAPRAAARRRACIVVQLCAGPRRRRRPARAVPAPPARALRRGRAVLIVDAVRRAGPCGPDVAGEEVADG